MGYLAAWKVLEEMITDFRKRGLAVPADVVNDLKSAKTLINIWRADPSRIDTSHKVDGYLRNVEFYMISEGQKWFGHLYVEEWLRRLDEARSVVFEEEEEARFISRLPRGQTWIRVKPSDEWPWDKIKELADELNLSRVIQNDGCLLVYGEKEHVRGFIKKMAAKYGLRTEK